MSDHTKIIVGLKKESIKDGELAQAGLYYAGYGYGGGKVWSYVMEARKHDYFQKVDKAIVEDTDNGTIYGIGVAGTWNGAILLDDILKPIKEAKILFKKITGQEGKVYIIGEQE